MPRRADITLGDYGGKDYSSYNDKDIKRGLSLIILNSPKSKSFFEQIRKEIYFEKKDLQALINVQKNIAHSNRVHPKREEFFEEYIRAPFKKTRIKYLEAPLKLRLIYKIGEERYYKSRRYIKKIILWLLRRSNEVEQ